MRLRLFHAEALWVGSTLTAFQILVAMSVAGVSPPSQAYLRLCRWDCEWYSKIALLGYRSTDPPVRGRPSISNVAFFPAYPYAGRTLYLAFGVTPRVGLLIVAQLFCAMFWTAVWTFLRRMRVPPPLAAIAVLLILAHPAVFYLVSGYSESLFLAALVLFVLQGSARQQVSKVPAAFWGFVMSATRIVGIPVAAFPLLQRFFRGGSLLGGSLVATAAATGGLSFLLYCQLRFGRFDLYMESQRIGWGVVPDYTALFRWGEFGYLFQRDRIATQASGFAFLTLFCVEWVLSAVLPDSGWRKRAPLLLLAFLIFAINVSGLKSVGFMSMIRYSLIWHVMIVMCLAQLAHLLPLRRYRQLLLPAAVGVGIVCLILFRAFQLPALREFLNGRWYA